MDKEKHSVRDSREIQRYLRSDENKRICEPYVLECERLAEIADSYSNKCSEIYRVLNDSVAREEYSIGGECLHRGYYCPSPIVDIVVGGLNRGKLLKHLTAKHKPTFKYGFNSKDELIVVNRVCLETGIKENEIIIQHERIKTSFVFCDEFGISAVSECVNIGEQITSYTFCLNSSYNKHVSSYIREDYHYSPTGIKIADFFIFSNDRDAPILQHSQYHFHNDEEGHLSGYTVKNFEGDGSAKLSVWDGHIFKVRLTRKL